MKQLTTLILIFCFSLAYAQDSVLEKTNKLIEARKYSSAMKMLNKADPENQNPDIALAKTDLVLNYFTKSVMHQLFGLKDLKPDEELSELRDSHGNFDMYLFTPDSVLLNLIHTYPENYRLRKTLGNYYHEVHLKYPKDWFVSDSIVVEQFKSYYLMAYNHNVFDYWSLYGIGYAYLTTADYKNSVTYFEKSIAAKNDYPSSYYNLAYAYMYLDQPVKGIENAIKAMDLYSDSDYIADAARMIGIMYNELSEKDKSLDYFSKANELYPHDYYTLKPMLDVEVALNKETYKNRTKEFFLLAPGNPTIYQDLMQIYWDNNKPDELIEFLETQKPEFLKDDIVTGNIYFYEASIQYDKEDFTNSKLNFEKARAIFKKVYPADHKVFGVINSYTEKM